MSPRCLPSFFSINGRKRRVTPPSVRQETQPPEPPAYAEKERITPTIVDQWYDKNDPILRDISMTLHGYHELAFKEYKSAKLISDFLEKEGFTMERGIAGDETAFVGAFTQGKKGPVVSFNAV